MYYQVKDSHGGKPATGTGIGLAVSRRLAKIWAAILGYQRTGQRFNLYVDDPRTVGGRRGR